MIKKLEGQFMNCPYQHVKT